MSIDWSRVKESDVKEACSRYDAGERQPKRSARNTFLLLSGRRYPAKFIRGLAYEIATGDELDPNTDYTGGAETKNFFRTLGFAIEYKGEVIDGVHNRKHERKPNAQPNATHSEERMVSSPKAQRDLLKNFLEQRFDSVETEAKFDWLTVPDRVSTDEDLNEIYETLASIRGYNDFSTPGYPLACDFYVPSKNLIIEYDEKQHFTIQRAESLSVYPSDLHVGFDADKWRKSCESIRAVDTDPIYRDEQRAFYDSTRDILAARNGMTLIRIKHGDVDWNAPNSQYELDRLLSCYIKNYPSADLSSGIQEFESIGDDRRKDLNGWVATVTLQSNDRDYSHNERMVVLSKIVDRISKETSGDGVILFPGGWFYTYDEKPSTKYNWAEEKIGDLLGEIEERIIVCIGIDGNAEADCGNTQISLAVDKNGIKAIGRKFHPAPQENVELAHDYLSKEDGKSRIFELNSVKYYMCVCYDTYGLRHEDLPNPGVNIILNLVHSFYPAGEGSSGTSYFAKHGFAGASKQWDCPVFGAVVFFRRDILQNWPTGVYWNQGSKSTTEWRYVYNPIKYENEFEVNIEEGLALIRIYDLKTMQRTDTA